MIIFSCFMLGLRTKKCRFLRVDELENLFSCMTVLEKEISYSLCEIEPAMKKLIEYSIYTNKEIFTGVQKKLELSEGKPLSQIWRDVVNECRSSGCYLKEDIEVINQFGNVLGSGDVDTQIKNIDIFKTKLKEKIESAKQTAEKTGNLSFKIGLYAGIGLVIFII